MMGEPESLAAAPARWLLRFPPLGPGSLRADTWQLLAGSVLVIASTVLGEALGGPYWGHTMRMMNMLITAAALQNLLIDDAGQASFGQGAILGVSAYATAIVSGMYGYSYAAGACAGLVASMLVGLLVALPALRVQGFYLGFVTLSIAAVYPTLLLAFSDQTNGISGISRSVPILQEPVVAGLSGASLLTMAAVVAALGLHTGLRRSRLGRRMRVAASSPEAALTLGINPGAMRMIAFLLVNFGTALVGLLYLPITGFVGPSSFGVDLSIMLFFAVIVGGQGNIAGPVFGVWILYLVPNVLFETLPNFRLLIYGVVTLVVMLLLPRGVLGTIRHALERRRTRQTPPSLHIGEVLEGRRSSAIKPADSGTPAIVVQGGSKRFGRVAALEQVTLTVRAGTIHGLVGLNGSGKTTLLNVLSGLTKLSAGTVTINGIDCTHLAAYRIARHGLGRTFQTPRIFTALTLWENLLVGADAARGHALTSAARRERWPDTPVDWLPHGQRRLLEVARIALKEADLLLFDEPAAGLSPEERDEFAALMRHLRDEMGCTIVLVEHDLDLVWSVADHITVLETGRIVADGAPAEIAGLAAVNALFVEPPDA